MKVQDIITETRFEKSGQINPDDYDLANAYTWTEHGDEDDEYDYDVNMTEWDIVDRTGKKVGELRQDDYFGYLSGHLHQKDLPHIEDYGRHSAESPLDNLRAFLHSKTGRKWANNLHKYR